MKCIRALGMRWGLVAVVVPFLFLQIAVNFWSDIYKGPVASDMHFERAFAWDDAAQEWNAPIAGRKDRECAFVMSGLKAFAKVGVVWHRIPFRFVKDSTGGYSRPTGVQSFSAWAWRSGRDPSQSESPFIDIRTATQVRVITEHICDDALLPWQNGYVFTEIGPFPTNVHSASARAPNIR
jgi:hypothetical protein